MDVQEGLRRGAELHRRGRLAEAEAAYRAVLAASPDEPDALHLLGLIAHAAGQHEAALDLIQRALAHRPHFPAAHYSLGRLFQDQRRYPLAEAAYRQAIAGLPTYADAHNNLGGTLQAQNRLEEARASYEAALAINSDYAEGWSNLGTVLQDLGRPAEAVAAYQRALTIKPDYVEALHNLGEALQDMHEVDGAVKAYERALGLRPNYPETRAGLAFALLRRGDFCRGWMEYEWRWQRRDMAAYQRDLPGAEWDGHDPAGKSILLVAEQGYGDTLQFARYAAVLAERGARVSLECQPALERLLHSLPGISQVVARGQPLPEYDAHLPLMSAPRVCDTRLETIPARLPYLAAAPDLIRDWAGRIPADPRLQVGVVWAANPHHQQARSFRSMPLSALAPLTAVANIRLFSLQKDAAGAFDPSVQLTDLAPLLTDFAETAAAIMNLDLVITVDTAMAHLAGALGRPVWVMLPYASEWRWLRDRSDSPWYPTMRLFRQPIWGDWASVVASVASELATLTKSTVG